jgi:hypothetical protein
VTALRHQPHEFKHVIVATSQLATCSCDNALSAELSTIDGGLGIDQGMADTQKLTDRTVKELLAAARDKLLRSERARELAAKAHSRAKQESLVIAYNVLATVEVVGMAFGMGYLRGYYGEKAAIMGLPVDAATGLLLHGVAYGLGIAGGKVAHFVAFNLHNLANGALATWASATGAQMGLKKRQGVGEDQPLPQPQQLPAPPAPPQPVQGGDQGAWNAWGVGAANPQLPPQQMSWNPWGVGAIPQQQEQANPQLPPQQMSWNPWGVGVGNPWGAMPQQQANPLTQEELAAAMAWQQQPAAA